MPVDVVFRIFEGQAIAIFPGIASSCEPKYCLSYQIIGQHGDCLPGYIMNNSDAVTTETYDEYMDLREELEDIGYELNRVYMLDRKYLAQRKKQLAA